MSSIGGIIQDGTGKGYFAQVDSSNRLRVRNVGETTYDDASMTGESFNVNTQFVSVTVGTEFPLFYFKNNEASDVVVVAWFIGIGVAGGSPTENALMRVYGNPSSVTGGTNVTVTNRRIGDARIFAFDAKSSPTWTPAGTPVLYQTQTASSRVFGTVNLTLPRNASLIVTCQLNGAQTANIYTGFTGYVAGE
jgi:hypothetical protein